MNGKNIFCRGILCRKSDRKFKCKKCHVYVCSVCSVNYKGKRYCIDCYIEYYVEDDFKEMINKGLEGLKIK